MKHHNLIMSCTMLASLLAPNAIGAIVLGYTDRVHDASAAYILSWILPCLVFCAWVWLDKLAERKESQK